MLVKTKIMFLLLAVIITAMIFTTCETPMGMGDPIDWEAPKLKIDPFPNPLYVRAWNEDTDTGTELTGTVTDNLGVESVVFINTATGKELFPVKRDGDNWSIKLKFSSEQNGEKIVGEVRAYDRMKNSDEGSVAIVTMIVDIRPPVIEDVQIKRTNTRIARLRSYRELKTLETTDPAGDKKENLYSYQNGWFTINGVLNDNETKIEIISLDLYDVTDAVKAKTKLLSLPIDEGTTNYFPVWTIKEEDIINEGMKIWGGSYRTNYYENGGRYYYNVVINAIDKSNNSSETTNFDIPIDEFEGCLCLFAKSDEPKGILDLTIGTVVPRGTPLPVDFFDDDSLAWAYAGFLTEKQWDGAAAINSGVMIPSSYNDDQKLDWLKTRLIDNKQTTYNWRYDKYSGNTSEPIIDQIQGKSLDEKLYYVPTGNAETDYGDFVLFTLTADTKLPPHDGKGPESTNKTAWKGRFWRVSVVDENIPLIVFDTSKSPEENTFPKLEGGEKFKIVGYTLRENATGLNKVNNFRLAWIPYGMDGGPDKYIPAVQKALSDNKTNSYDDLPGVMHWDITFNSQETEVITPDDPTLQKITYIRQNFSKEFSVLNDFKYKGVLENETKLFIFYAIDNMGHEVYRQLRLLGWKTPPTMVVYDISNKRPDVIMPAGIPDPNNAGYTDPATGGVTATYYTALKTYNTSTPVYNALLSKSGSVGKDDETIPFQIYPRGTTLKYWIKAAEANQDIGITNITMKDITFTQPGIDTTIGYYNPSNKLTYSYCEYFPDVTRRTFLIEATDALGNVARVQRTIAVTNAAQLDNITTTTQDGTYGIGQTITINANFTNQVYVTGTPQLRIRYKENGADKYELINCNNPPTKATPALSLQFNFTVPDNVNASGKLETLFEDPGFSIADKRPIILPSGAGIFDLSRGDSAFLPGYTVESVTYPNWTDNKKTLQAKKNIQLDGTRPTISSFTGGGKDAYTDTNYYFKTGDTITFTLTASEAVLASGTPRLSYTIGSTSYNTTPAFAYQRPGTGNTSLVFSLPVNTTNCPNEGWLTSVNLLSNAAGSIVDEANNSANAVNIYTGTGKYYVKQTTPAAPSATLAGTSPNPATFGTNPDTVINYSTTTTLTIQPSNSTFEDRIQYSLDGVNWTLYTAAVPISNGTYNIKVRYLDRAGNEGAERRQRIQVNANFPNPVAISASGNGWFTTGNLNFTLSFDDTVTVNTAASVSITLTNANSNNINNPNGTNPSYQIVLTAATGQTNTTSIRFDWNNINTSGKEMRDGLYVSAVNLTGLRDRFGNIGPNITVGTVNGVIVSGCTNLPAGSVKVDSLYPKVSTRNPTSEEQASSLTSKITLTFNEPVQKGSGIITIRPRGNYSIPPVFTDEGYTNSDGTYISSFYDIYTNSLLNAADRNTLTVSATAGQLTTAQTYNATTGAPTNHDTTNPSMTRLFLNQRTGQSYGPYKKTTQGLVAGRGYSGDYTSGATVASPLSGDNSPDTKDGYMVPDIATKWVLDYQYKIDETSGAVDNIRNVLNKAKFRWQEIDVVNTSIGTGSDNNKVTIALNEPLLSGLEWDVYYPAGTFTDMAGNPAAACGGFTNGNTNGTNNDYWFTSYGVQPPVIRVNRRSYDARNSNWITRRTYDAPGTSSSWNVSTTVSDKGLSNDSGWNIADFNVVHYRVESESKNAVIQVGTYLGNSINRGAARGGFSTNNVLSDNSGAKVINDTQWDTANNNTPGTWVLSNIIRRSATSTANSQTYTVIKRDGMSETRQSNGAFSMFRSYNRDLKLSELNDGSLIPLSTKANGVQDVIVFGNALEANKSYITASAKLPNGDAVKGYEGVYRTVIMLNVTTARDLIVVQASNIKNGMPSIAGFPIREEGVNGDFRFFKAFYNNSGGATGNQFYWVSTEIVSELYFIGYYLTNTTSGNYQIGDLNNHFTVSYGDLTYCRHQ
jgi:hypothetical protein